VRAVTGLNHYAEDNIVQFLPLKCEGSVTFTSARHNFREWPEDHSTLMPLTALVERSDLHSDKKISGTSIHIPREPAAALVFRPASFFA
jgi:hypothetical protein